MDTNKTKLAGQQTNTEIVWWKLPDYRKDVIKKCTEEITKQREWKDVKHLSELVQHLERFEARINDTAKNEVEYLHYVSQKVKSVASQLRTSESKPCHLNSTSSKELSGQEVGQFANIEWKEQVYQKVQKMSNAYFSKLYVIYQSMNRKLKQLESSPQEQNSDILGKNRKAVKTLEFIFSLLRVSKSQITTEFKEKLDKAEKYIQQNIFQKNISSNHHGQQHSIDLQSSQQSSPLDSSVAQMEILETKPSPQTLGTQNKMCLQEQKSSPQTLGTQNKMYLQEQKPSPQTPVIQSSHMTKDVSQQNKKCSQKQKVAKQYSNTQQGVNKLSIIKGPNNAIQQREVTQRTTKAFSVNDNTQGLSALPLIENNNNHKDISHKPALTSQEPSPAMQHLLEVLTSISPEALSVSVGEIRDVLYLDDVIPTSELINGPLMGFQQQNPPSLIPQTKRKRPQIMNSLTTFDASRICASSCDSFNHFTNAEKPDSISVTSKIKHPIIAENCSLLEEIKEINNLLVDCEVIISEKDIFQSEVGGAAEHDGGLVIKFLFNGVTINQDLISHLFANKKSIIKPLWLLVPTNYPLSSPFILDHMLMETSGEVLKDLSATAKSKLRISLQCLNQPWSLKAIAKSWEHCTREAILEYAQGIGGGTFSSKYGGGWQMCQDYVKGGCNISDIRFA